MKIYIPVLSVICFTAYISAAFLDFKCITLSYEPLIPAYSDHEVSFGMFWGGGLQALVFHY